MHGLRAFLETCVKVTVLSAVISAARAPDARRTYCGAAVKRKRSGATYGVRSVD
jgi:hypothetical protein